MDRRRFGCTGLAISSFTLGGGIVGGILSNPPDNARLETLRRAVAAGRNWIDTAADYGGGESEKALGRLLPEVTPRPQWVLAKPGIFLDSVGDLTLLPAVLRAASAPPAPVSDAAMADLGQRAGLASIFGI